MKLVNWKQSNNIFDNFDNYFNDFIDSDYLNNNSNILIDQNDKSYFLSLDMPGIDKSDISITIDEDIININAERKSGAEDVYANLDGYKYSKSFYVPENSLVNKIKARSKNGVLILEIPKMKKEKKQIKKIDVV